MNSDDTKLLFDSFAQDDNLLDLQHAKYHLFFTNMLTMVGKASKFSQGISFGKKTSRVQGGEIFANTSIQNTIIINF
jgi:hypothetical protein